MIDGCGFIEGKEGKEDPFSCSSLALSMWAGPEHNLVLCGRSGLYLVTNNSYKEAKLQAV